MLKRGWGCSILTWQTCLGPGSCLLLSAYSQGSGLPFSRPPPHAIFLIWALDWSVFLRQIILDLSNHIISSSCVLLLKLSLNDLWILLIFLLPQMLSHRSLEEMFYMLIFLIAPPPLPSEILEHLAVFLCWDRRFKNACYCGLLISFKKGQTEGVCAL